MSYSLHRSFLIFFLLLLLGHNGRAADFFKIQKIVFLSEASKKNPKFGVIEEKVNPQTKKRTKEAVFEPVLEVSLSAKEQIRSLGLTIKAYFYDETGNLIETVASPSVVTHETGNYVLPAFLDKGRRESVYFPVSDKVRQSKWVALVVFGDTTEADVEYFPKTASELSLNYPEKPLVEKKSQNHEARVAVIDPLVEQVVETKNPEQPRITLFMRPPKGVTQGKDVKGVMTLCLLANNLEEIRLFMLNQSVDGREQNNALLKFADDNQLAIIAWSSRRAWVLKGSYYQFNNEEIRFMDKSFDEVATAWEKGVKILSVKYGIPKENFLLWAMSGAANWAHRLALRKPEYFAAVHVEILSTYDKPTSEAKNIMWLLTTGELEGGYESSKRFYKDCKDLGYPMIYKAYPGVGHAGCPAATKLGLEFFKFALEQIETGKDIRENNSLRAEEIPELIYKKRMEAFLKPSFYGDIVNQDLYPAAKINEIPAGYRVALPTDTLASLWDKP